MKNTCSFLHNDHFIELASRGWRSKIIFFILTKISPCWCSWSVNRIFPWCFRENLLKVTRMFINKTTVITLPQKFRVVIKQSNNTISSWVYDHKNRVATIKTVILSYFYRVTCGVNSMSCTVKTFLRSDPLQHQWEDRPEETRRSYQSNGISRKVISH